MLRVPAALHARMRAEARAAGVSLNEYCVRQLTLPAGAAELAPALAQAFDMYGDDLMGVVVFGSWARGEATAESDIDLLIVLGGAVTRERYRTWDDAPLTTVGLRVEPMLVNLPADDGRVSSLWAEVAVDGLVLYDRDLSVSRYLAGIRRQIVSGAMQQRSVHGQHYWVRTA